MSRPAAMIRKSSRFLKPERLGLGHVEDARRAASCRSRGRRAGSGCPGRGRGRSPAAAGGGSRGRGRTAPGCSRRGSRWCAGCRRRRVVAARENRYFSFTSSTTREPRPQVVAAPLLELRRGRAGVQIVASVSISRESSKRLPPATRSRARSSPSRIRSSHRSMTACAAERAEVVDDVGARARCAGRPPAPGRSRGCQVASSDPGAAGRLGRCRPGEVVARDRVGQVDVRTSGRAACW